MADDEMPVPGLPDVVMREGVLPDGARMVIAVDRGLSQDDVDLLALRVWQEMPEPGAGE